jgi:ribonuclease HI
VQLALKLSKEQRVNIYSDSKYVFLILYAHAAIWKERGMLTTTGSPVRHACNILALLDAILFPKEYSVIHCRGHQKGDDKIARGNKQLMRQLNGKPCRNIKLALWEGTLLLSERPQY